MGLNFTRTPNFDPQIVFFHFFKLVIFGDRCNHISSVALCVELAEFLDIFKMTIFKPIFTIFLKFSDPFWLKILRGLWPYTFFRYYDLKVPKSWKNMCEIAAWQQITIWGLTVPLIKKLKKTKPHFLSWPLTKQDIKLYMWGTSLTQSLTHLLTHWRGKLVNPADIVARPLKFGM